MSEKISDNPPTPLPKPQIFIKSRPCTSKASIWKKSVNRSRFVSVVKGTYPSYRSNAIKAHKDVSKINIEVTALFYYRNYSSFSKRRLPLLLLVLLTLGFALITSHNLYLIVGERRDYDSRTRRNSIPRTPYFRGTKIEDEDVNSDVDDRDIMLTGRPATHLFEKEIPLPNSPIHPKVKIFKSSPVTELSNGLLFPLVGIGVGNIEHRYIPLIVQSHLDTIDSISRHRSPHQHQQQTYVDDGGIGLIDTVGSSIHINNEALVARQILYFTKQRNRQMQEHINRSSLRWNSLIDPDGPNEESDLDVSKSGINEPDQNKLSQSKVEVHIVTKIPHTHLGYGRTNLAIQESLKVLSTVFPQQSSNVSPLVKDLSSSGNVSVRVHVVLHSPRCDKGSSFPNCEEDEEKVVDAQIQQAGPSPNSESWKESWRALEEAYANQKINSIGVSNFNIDELNELLSFCKVKPHFYQGSIWSVLFDVDLMTLLRENSVLFHAFNVMKGIIHRKDVAPHAFRMLENISKEIRLTNDKENKRSDVEGKEIDPASRLILAWLVQHGIAVSPKSSSIDHISINSPISIGHFPKLSPVFDFEVEKAVRALLLGEDIHFMYYNPKRKGSILTFSNRYEKSVVLYRVGENVYDKVNEVKISELVEPGKTIRFVSYPGDDVVIYDEKGQEVGRETII